MKFSEAIRLGAMNAPQTVGALQATVRVPGWRGWLLGRTQGATCALGAAFQASGAGVLIVKSDGVTLPFRGTMAKAGTDVRQMQIPATWMTLLWMIVRCPLCSCGGPLLRIVPHLNDDHKLTRPQIADFVETLELTQTAGAVDPHVASHS